MVQIVVNREAMNSGTSDKRRTILYLLVANLLLFFGFRIWQTTINNFAVEDLGVGALDVGWMHSLREVPGLAGFLLGFLAIYLSEVRIMAVSVILLGGGLFLTGQASSLTFLLTSTFVMSYGFHLFLPSSDSVVLMVQEIENAPKFLGQLNSLGSFAALIATGIVYLLAEPLGYRNLFMLMGGLVAVGGILLLPLGGSQKGLPTRRKVVLRKKYWLYYLLAFLMGSRRHIFTTFAIFLLVKNFEVTVQTIALLFLVNSLVNVFSYQFIGRLVSRLGERLMLSIAFSILAFIFLGYAFVDSLSLLFVFFVVDNMLFGFNLALNTYFQKIAVTQEEITSNVAVNQTINHISAVLVPVIGGAAWEFFGAQMPFLVGAGIVLLSLILVQFLRVPGQSDQASEALPL